MHRWRQSGVDEPFLTGSSNPIHLCLIRDTELAVVNRHGVNPIFLLDSVFQKVDSMSYPAHPEYIFFIL